MGDVIIPDERIQEYEEKKRARENKKKRLSQDRMRDRDEVEIDRSDGDDDKEEKTTTKKKSSPLKLYVIFEHEINHVYQQRHSRILRKLQLAFRTHRYVHFYCDRWAPTRVRITNQSVKEYHVHIARVLPPGRQHFCFSLTGRMDDSFTSSAFEHDDVPLRFPPRANYIIIEPRKPF